MNQADWLRKRMRKGKRLGCAPEIGAVLLVSMLALAWIGPALAVEGDPEKGGPSIEKKLGDYLADLGGDDGPERLFAARTVKGETRRALAAMNRAPADSLAALEGRSTLVEIDARAPSACANALTYPNTAVLCAEILADLGHPEMIGRIEASRALVPDKGGRRRIDAALAILAALPPAEGTAPPPAAAPPPPTPAP
ncbi:MAG: hypothetical protein EXR71_18275 [Myxococcales bacterium]|nr:hypothetical protein [Myxococcales bacterium]